MTRHLLACKTMTNGDSIIPLHYPSRNISPNSNATLRSVCNLNLAISGYSFVGGGVLFLIVGRVTFLFENRFILAGLLIGKTLDTTSYVQKQYVLVLSTIMANVSKQLMSQRIMFFNSFLTEKWRFLRNQRAKSIIIFYICSFGL